MIKTIDSFSSFSVQDILEAQHFYTNILGLQATQSPEGLDISPNGNKVFLYPKPNHTPATFTVLNFKVEDIDSAVNDLVAKGIIFEQYPDLHTDVQGICQNDGTYPGPKAIAWFKDPSGNILSVIQEK
jgi:catechol 2,3-dioxygenase-like lactoylglutathione lyase family enzyme